MKEKAPLTGELSPQATEGFPSLNPSDLASLGHLPC